MTSSEKIICPLCNDTVDKLRNGLIKRIQSCKYISPHYMHVDGTSFAANCIRRNRADAENKFLPYRERYPSHFY